MNFESPGGSNVENKDALLTVKEVASILRLSLTETYKLIQSRAISHFRVGPGRGAIRIDRGEIDLFLEKRRVGVPETKPVAVPVRLKPLKHIRTKN
jgi:excisionase family DNA binding protein